MNVLTAYECAFGLTRRGMIFSSFALAACASGDDSLDASGSGPAPDPGDRAPAPGAPEAELARRSRDLQRPMLDASKFGVLGARGVYVLGGPSGFGAGVGRVGPIPVIFLTVSYSGYLQNELPTDEARRARIRSDIQLTNFEAEAAISTIETVTRRQESRVATAKSLGSEAALREASAVGRNVVQDIVKAEAGLVDRQREVTPAIQKFAPPTVTDPALATQVAVLDKNIQDMRIIARSTRDNPIFSPN